MHFFLFETLVHTNRIEDIRRHIGFDHCFIVDKEGGGGVAFLWRNSFNYVVTSYSLNFINVEVDDLKNGK